MKKSKSNLRTYCISHKYNKSLDELKIIKIGSGAYKKSYPSHWLNDSIGKKNISKKNSSYGSLTSIYWIWKNQINKLNKNQYIGICHYRRFWLKYNHDNKVHNKNLKKNLLTFIPKKFCKYDAFLCSPINLQGYKFSKLIKKGKRSFIKDPTILFDKKKHTINLHSDIFHIHNGLVKACKFLNKSDRIDFWEYINKKTEFYPLSIFVIKKQFFDKLCYETFVWLKKCEKIFNTNKLKGYGEVRIFDFLAERYFSFWITKYCKHKVWPYKHIEAEK